MLVLVVYDIPDDRRRLKLAQFLEGYGQRVQYSVFECYVSLSEMRQMHRAIAAKVNSAEDNVRLYWLPERAAAQTLCIGSHTPIPPPDSYIV